MSTKNKPEVKPIVKKKEKDDSLYGILEEAGLTMKNIVLVDPTQILISVNDKKFLTGMPSKYNGIPIKYEFLDEKQIKEFQLARSSIYGLSSSNATRPNSPPKP